MDHSIALTSHTQAFSPIPAGDVSDVHMTNADEDGGAQPQPLFSRNDRVFAKDGKSLNNEKYYPAIIKNRRFKDDRWQYKAHFHGWNSRYDQWLSNDQVLNETEENRTFLQGSNLLEDNAGTKKEEDTTTCEPTAEAAKSKRKREGDRAASSKTNKRRPGAVSLLTMYEEFCELPLTLKTILVDEMEKITRIGQDVPHAYDCPPTKAPVQLYHQLPAPVTIQQVLKHFYKKQSSLIEEACSKRAALANNNEAEASMEKKKAEKKTTGLVALDADTTARDVQEFCRGLSGLFEEALPKFLLYPQERSQYEAIQKSNELSRKPLTEIYGCEYLLRLYVRLPNLMQSEVASNIKVVGPLLAELLVLLQKNKQACFKGGYRENPL